MLHFERALVTIPFFCPCGETRKSKPQNSRESILVSCILCVSVSSVSALSQIPPLYVDESIYIHIHTRTHTQTDRHTHTLDMGFPLYELGQIGCGSKSVGRHIRFFLSCFLKPRITQTPQELSWTESSQVPVFVFLILKIVSEDPNGCPGLLHTYL